jgi:hypothetical protein
MWATLAFAGTCATTGLASPLLQSVSYDDARNECATTRRTRYLGASAAIMASPSAGPEVWMQITPIGSGRPRAAHSSSRRRTGSIVRPDTP